MRVRIAATFAARARGLLGRSRAWLGDGGLLVIVPCSSVHTFGMRDDIDVAFVAADGTVLKSVQGVLPGKMLWAHGAVAVIERFALPMTRTGKAQQWFSEGDSVTLRGRGELGKCQASGKCATISCARH